MECAPGIHHVYTLCKTKVSIVPWSLPGIIQCLLGAHFMSEHCFRNSQRSLGRAYLHCNHLNSLLMNSFPFLVLSFIPKYIQWTASNWHVQRVWRLIPNNSTQDQQFQQMPQFLAKNEVLQNPVLQHGSLTAQLHSSRICGKSKG